MQVLVVLTTTAHYHYRSVYSQSKNKACHFPPTKESNAFQTLSSLRVNSKPPPLHIKSSPSSSTQIPNPMYMQALNRYSFSSIAVVSFALCLAAELKKTKKDDLILDGKLCYLPRSSSFELGIAAVICLSITQVAGSLFIYRKFRPREKRGKFIVTRSLLLLSWIGFGVAVILLSAASSMNQNQAFGEGWLDGECYLVKDGVYVGSAILTLVALGSTLGSGIVAVRRDKAEETQGSLVHAKVDK
ncbi:protein MODIFYING WALL LIGNIN-1-like [Salvia miltiorrhiza]|uniref:protein MODIFYING WALL LIGNIN-1-like n=1 Tax=Salvia miltiorrhiza TaxID=226208 RepID=UPI0025ACE944|nr:protein MODIFYING WALL LIGNIN-1-like [Salvia miltiorrhiza]